MKRILLVEDEFEFRLIIQFMLELFGCQVDFAQEGQAAVEMAVIHQYDCILMDIGLPKLDGFKACKAIKKYKIAKNSFPTPIVALTEITEINHLDRCIDAGMTMFLFKPIQAQPLQRLIHSLDLAK